MKHWLDLLLLTLILLFTSCSPAPKEVTVKTPTATTTILSTWTKTVTATPSPPKATTTPEATVTPTIQIDENDLEPHFTLPIDENVRGAQITGAISSDESLAISNPSIYGFSLSESAAALFLSRAIYQVFEHQNPGISYNEYMKMIAEVQKAGKNNEPTDPSKIAILVYANDKMDGNGYVQQQYYIVPWYTGSLPEEIENIPAKAIKDINVDLVRASRVDNLTTILDASDTGFGTNINHDNLELYVALSYGTVSFPANNRSTAQHLAELPWWLINNNGRDMHRTHGIPESESKDLYNLLRSSGFAVKPSRP